MTSRLLALCALVLAGCGPPVNPAPLPPTYEATGAEGNLEVRRLGSWNQSPYQQRERQVVRDAPALDRIWAALGSQERPRVDFANDVVVLVAAGERTSGGHEIAVRRAALENGRLLLEVVATKPGPNCMTTMALTQPVEVVAVRAARAERWEFVEREEVRDC